jgi:hypothetical protein
MYGRAGITLLGHGFPLTAGSSKLAKSPLNIQNDSVNSTWLRGGWWSATPPSRWRGWWFNLDTLSTETELLCHFRSVLRIGRCGHRMIGSQIPAVTIFVDAEPVLHPQMPAQHSGAKPALEAHHILGAHRLPDRHRRMARLRHGCGALPKASKGSVHLADQAHELAWFDLVMPHVAADNARDLFNNAAGYRDLFGH